MLESVALIGRMLAENEEEIISNIIIEISEEGKKSVESSKKNYIVKLNFQTKDENEPLKIEIREDDNKARHEYMWVGNEKGSTKKTRLTTDQLRYLISEAPVNLYKQLQNPELKNMEIYTSLEKLIDNFYCDLEADIKILCPDKIGLEIVDEKKLLGKVNSKNNIKEIVSEMEKALKKKVSEVANISPKEISLWTVLIDGKPMVQCQGYTNHLLKSTGIEGGQDYHKGVCSICGAEDIETTYDFTKLKFLKYYINDKLGAASGLSEKGFAKNFQACQECFKGLVLAENFVKKRLGLKVGNKINFMVLPSFLWEAEINEELSHWAEEIRSIVSVITNTAKWSGAIESIKKLDVEFQDLLEKFENLVLLNFLFYHAPPGRSEFKVLSLIKDITPSRITRIVKRSNKIAGEAKNLFGENLGNRCWIDLESIFQLIPLRQGANDLGEYKKLLHIYDCVLSDKPINKRFLINEFVSLVSIYNFKNFKGTNVIEPKGDEELEWTFRIIKANLFLKFLEEENLLRGVKPLSKMNNDLENLEKEFLDEEILEYFNMMHYTLPEKALFILGYLINQIGYSQKNKGYESKPVLDKINFAGMSWSKVLRLSNLVVDQMRSYDIFRYNEGLYSLMKELFDACKPASDDNEWPLSPEENVFYILSGYAFGTRMALKKATDKKKKENNEENKDLEERSNA